MIPFISTIRKRVFYGWWILLLGSVINAVGGGILYQSFSVFFLPLKRDFAVSSAAISLLYGAARLEGGLEGPIVGYLIDRLGPRTMMIIGTSMTGGGLILLSLVGSFWPFFFIYIGFVCLGYNAGFFHPTSTAVNNWFIRRRGLGFSVLSASTFVGGMILAPILSYIILNHG
jgi:MFS family permease